MLEFAKKVFKLSKGIKNRIIKDQLCRAALSIPLNIAEGNGRMHPREKRQYFCTARGSLLECVPIIRLCAAIDYLDKKNHEELYGLAEEIGKMLSGLIKSIGV